MSPPTLAARALDAAIDLPIAASAVDSAGTSVLMVPPGVRHARVPACPALRALEVRGGQDLAALDLAALPDDLMLYVRDLPSLRQLWLPRGAGSHLHVALAAPPALRIDGDLSYLDACWPAASGHAGTLSSTWNGHARALRPPVLRGAWLGEAAGAPADVELLAVCGDPAARLDLSAHPAACVLVEDAAGLEALVVGSPRLLAVRAAPRLAAVVVSHAPAVSVEGAPALARIDGAGIQVSLCDSARVPTLELTGEWTAVLLHREGPVQLIAPKARKLHTALITRLRYDASTLSRSAIEAPSEARLVPAEQLLLAAAQELGAGQRVVGDARTKLVRAMNQLGPQRGLEALAALAAAGGEVQLAHLWELRDALARAHQRHKGPRADLPWAWHFPTDLGDRGWRADLQLWLRCRAVSGVALAFEATVRASAGPEHLAAIADLAQDPANAPGQPGPGAQVDPIALLRAQLEAGIEAGVYKPATPGRKQAPGIAQVRAQQDPVAVDALARVVRALVRLRARPEAPALTDALCRWVVARLPDGTGIAVLALLRAFGARRAPAAFAELHAHPALRPELQHSVLMASLQPIQHPYLAFPEAPPDDR